LSEKSAKVHLQQVVAKVRIKRPQTLPRQRQKIGFGQSGLIVPFIERQLGVIDVSQIVHTLGKLRETQIERRVPPYDLLPQFASRALRFLQLTPIITGLALFILANCLQRQRNTLEADHRINPCLGRSRAATILHHSHHP
jgi:hypothetical protein